MRVHSPYIIITLFHLKDACWKTLQSGIRGSTFNKDYTSRHCRNSHPNYNITTLPTTTCREPNQSSLSSLLGSREEEQIPQPPHVVIDTQPQDNQLLRDQPDEAIKSKEGQSHSHDEVADNDEVEQDENDGKISEEMIEFCKTTSSHSETERTGSVTIEKDTERWTTCYGKLRHWHQLLENVKKCFPLLIIPMLQTQSIYLVI